MSNRFLPETIYRIHDDATNDYLEIRWEVDSFDTKELIELCSYSYNELTNRWDPGNRIAMHVDSIDSVIQALSHFKKV